MDALFLLRRQHVGRVLAWHCHCACGKPVQAQIGKRSLDERGFTVVSPDAAGKVPNARIDAGLIVPI